MNTSLLNHANRCFFLEKIARHFCGSLLVIIALFCFSTSSTFAQRLGANITLQTQHAVTASELEDHNDYYYLASGKKLKLYRKKDTFVVRGTKANNLDKNMRRFKASHGERVKRVRGHGLGSALVVRLENNPSFKAKGRQNYSIDAPMLKRLDNSISNIDPVFTTASSQGDIMLLPRLTFELRDIKQLNTILDSYGLELNRKLKLSADVYSTSLKNSALDAEQIFRLVRRLGNEPSVSWAEPQFHFKPTRSAYTPTDPLFAKQWHLRDQGYRGSRCDTDCDADEAWSGATGASTGENTVIAIIDDGVQLNHPDLNVSSNGSDFVNDNSVQPCQNGQPLSDGTVGPDNDPSPRATANCELQAGDGFLQEDNHGTAVAGIAAATSNSIGVAGVAFNAQILPIRAISAFDQAPVVAGTEYNDYCSSLAEAFEYAAQYADVLNASWQIPLPCSVLETALGKVTSGTVTDSGGTNISRRQNLGSPVVFASGNNATGWVKVTIPVTSGPHAYEWRHLRSDDPDFGFDNDLVDQTVWLDDINWPDGSTEDFSSISNFNASSNEFSTASTANTCNAECDFTPAVQPLWNLETDASRIRVGTKSARLKSISGDDCSNSYLHIIKDGPAGNISFWVWVSANTEDGSDKFEFLVDGKEVLSYGDLAAFGFKDNELAYPASLSNDASANIDGIIAVGASGNGDLSGITSSSLSSEERASYSQYGPGLDVVAPGSNQHVGIVTTDRTGADGYNASGSSGDLSDSNYTQLFMGTSASAAIVSGVAATVIASNPMFSAEDTKLQIVNTADKIGTVPYDNGGAGRNDFHGFGRVNMHRALGGSATVATCAPDSFDFSNANDLLRFQTLPQSIAFCPARGPRVPDNSSCFVVKSVNDKVVTFCL